jgi:hypothetical protein
MCSRKAWSHTPNSRKLKFKKKEKSFWGSLIGIETSFVSFLKEIIFIYGFKWTSNIAITH